MNPITSSHVSAEVEVRIGGRARTYAVRPATVWEAIGLMDAAIAINSGGEDEEDAYRFMRAILSDWLPLSLASSIAPTRATDRRQIAQVALTLITPGIEAKKAAKKVNDEARSKSWTEVIADFMHAFGQSYQDVLDMPFIAFSTMATSLTDRVHAADMLRLMRVRSLPHMKSDSERSLAIDNILVAAGLKDAAIKDDDLPDWMRDPEAKKQKKDEMIAEALRVREIWRQKAGRA